MKTNSLIVKDTGIHVTDGEVEVICQDQEVAARILTSAKIECSYPECACVTYFECGGDASQMKSPIRKKDHPYPIPGLRFEVKGVCCSPLAPNINHHGDCDRCSFYSEVAILSVEDTKEESQEDDSMWKREYDAAVREIMDLQAQLKEANDTIRELEYELRNHP